MACIRMLTMHRIASSNGNLNTDTGEIEHFDTRCAPLRRMLHGNHGELAE